MIRIMLRGECVIFKFTVNLSIVGVFRHALFVLCQSEKLRCKDDMSRVVCTDEIS